MSIDWIKAPAEYPIWIEPTGSGAKGWFRDAGDRYTNGGGVYWTKPAEGFYSVHKRPEWSGEGLPPVGAVREVISPGFSHDRIDRFIGRVVTIVAHDVIDGTRVAVFRMPLNDRTEDQDYHALVAECFRPARTPEQIEREKACRGLQEAVLSSPNCEAHGIAWVVAEAIYDAGYRKQVQP